MNLSSPAFGNEQLIPPVYTCDDANINPPLVIQDVPTHALSLVLIVDDPDAPSGTFTHWLLWNIPPETSLLPQNSLPAKSIQGSNSFGNAAYDGPCPPLDTTHRYFFRLYALDKSLDYLSPGADRKDLESSFSGHIIGETELIGLFGH